MKTQEELQYELFNQTTEVENAINKLDKASMILGHWVNRYVFAERPDPGEAVKCWTSKKLGERDMNAEQSYQWFHEYSQIVGLVDIVFDYVHQCKKVLEKVVDGVEQLNKSA